MIRALALVAVLVSSAASAQIPLVSRLARGPTLSPLPQDATPLDYWAGAFMDQGSNCARFTVDGRNWLPCTATVADVAVVQADADAALGDAADNAAEIASLVTRVGVAEGLIASQATAISTLQSQVAALQALPAPFLYGAAVASGLSIPLLGVQTAAVTSTVAGAQVGAFCEVQDVGFGLLGASGICVVTSANTVTTRWVSNGGALSAVLSIPNGNYPLRIGRLP